MSTEIPIEAPLASHEPTTEPEPPWIYKDGYDQHYKVRYAGFTIDLDEWVTNQKVTLSGSATLITSAPPACSSAADTKWSRHRHSKRKEKAITQ